MNFQQTASSGNRIDWPLLRGLLAQHGLLLVVLAVHLVLSLAYSSLIPLGEAPDEPAHLDYARFIAKNGHLPASLEERQAAGYRSVWPPLYHLLVAGPLAAVGDAPPTRLKSVGDTPRRLIPTDGQTIASFIHTADEAWPWRGISLAWHLGRFISVLLTALTVEVTYAIAWRLTANRTLALSAAALHGTIPQPLFTGSVLNEDNLLILFSSLILLLLVSYTQQSTSPNRRQLFFLGALLGLASVAKYNALPLWPLTLIWGGWLALRTPEPTGRVFAFLSTLALRTRRAIHLLISLAILLFSAILTSAWWFLFIWLNFNRIETLGLIPGSLSALSAGTADASLRQLASGGSVSLPSLTAWLAWFVRLFQSFWGLFGGGGTIELAGWIYGLLAVICVLAIGSLLWPFKDREPSLADGLRHPLPMPSAATFLLLTPLFFVPLPMLRFVLSGGNMAETAQGRHLFPALPAIAFGLTWGLARLNNRLQLPHRSWPLLPALLIGLTTLLSLHSLSLIRASYPPPIPLQTTAEALTVENSVQANLVEGIRLVGYELEPVDDGVLPLTLVWQAEAIPSEDYLIELTLANPNGQPMGGWLGQPLGGRYPTRAWDEGDILRDHLAVPLIPGHPASEATLTLNLLDSSAQSRLASLTLVPGLTLPAIPPISRTPAQLRADDLPADASFTYRSTISFAQAEQAASELMAPSGQRFPAARTLAGPTGSIAHFIIEADWPGGEYQLSSRSAQPPIPVTNRSRQFEPPPIAETVTANFANRLTLLGYDLPRRRVQPGGSFPITLYWRAEQTMGRNLTVFNHLLDQHAVQRGGVDRIPLKYYTTLLWVPGEIVTDSYQVPVEAEAPPGIYWLDVGLYPADQPTFSLPLFVDGRPIDRNSVRLGPLKVGGPPPGLTLTEVEPQHPVRQTFGGQITLLGFNLADPSGQPMQPSEDGPAVSQTLNSEAQLSLFWRAEAIPAADYTVFVHLLDAQGKLAVQFDSPPAGGAYPTSLWEPDEIIVDERLVSGLPPGDYTLQVGLYRPDTGERLPVEGVSDGALRLMEFEVEE